MQPGVPRRSRFRSPQCEDPGRYGVIQVRGQDVSPEHLVDLVVSGLRQHEEMLEQGALISIDEARLRSRILPLIE